jgi:hypothetical protein
VYEVLEVRPSAVQRIRVRLGLARAPDDTGDSEEAARSFLAFGTPDEVLPDIVDAALSLLPERNPAPLAFMADLAALQNEQKARRKPL